MEKINEKQDNQAIERVSDINALAIHQSENTSERNGLIYVVYHASWSEIDRETFAEQGFEEEEREWHEVCSELPDRIEYLREKAEGRGYTLSDCRVSLAEYNKPELTEQNISSIKTFFLLINENENFYYSIVEDAREALLECCRKNSIPTPNEIQYTPNGYYIKWKLENGLSGREIPLWKFIQKTLHEYFAKLGSDATVCSDATAMFYVSGFKNSSYVGFDLSEEILTVYRDERLYPSAQDFIISLPLSVSEIEEYRKTRVKISKSAPKEEALRVELDDTARNKLLSTSIASAFKIAGIKGDCYRFRQYKAEDEEKDKAGDRPKRKKYYDWLKVNSRDNRYRLRADRDNWISAALFGYMNNSYTGVDALRKEERYAVSIDCNFVILKWEKSELDYIPTPEEGKELVLSECRKHELPEPRITYTVDGLEVKWYWRDRMTKENPEGNRFNHDWDRMQEELYRIFWYLGAEDSRINRGLSTITTMFRVPGSLNTTKKLKTDDRVVRDIHEGEIVSSYRDIQRILGLTPSEPERENPEEAPRQEWEAFSLKNGGLVNDWMREVFMIHPMTSRHWVCVGAIQGGKWKQHYIQACDLPKYLMRLAGTPEFSQFDWYVSQGEFQRCNDRKVSNLAGIRANFVDLDYKLLKQYHPEITENPTAEEWQELAEEHCASYMLPRPNATVFTGGGMHLKYIYEEAATSADLEAWQYAQKLLLEQFRTLGADPASVDAARVLRLAGTQNQKANPEIHDRKVRVMSAESFSERKLTLKGLIEELEGSKPENPEEFNALIAERNKRKPEQPKVEENAICSKSEQEAQVVPEGAEADCMKTSLRSKSGKHTNLRIGDNPEQIIETSQLGKILRILSGTAKVRNLSLSEQASANHKVSSEYIPANYVVMSKCPGATIEEQNANICKRCDEYREVGIPSPNHIIRKGSTLLAVWKYIYGLPDYAYSRWQVTQELLCRHFEDWGAMEKPESLTETKLLPIAGIEYDGGDTAMLEYVSSKRGYTFDKLATAVLNFSQEEVRKYEEQKEKEKAKREALRKLTKELAVSIAHTQDDQSRFRRRAYERLLDILTLFELRKDENGEIPQGTRELSVFWALVCAIQAGSITTYDEFKETAERFIAICGQEFECRVETVKSAFWKKYQVRTSTLIKKLQITPDEQKLMKVLIVGKDGKTRQPRAEWLAEHDQERRKPWIALKISRATYFRWKKAGKLPCVKVYDPIPLVEKKSETGISYIMTAAFDEGGIEPRMRYLKNACVRQARGVREKMPDGVEKSLVWCRRLRWLMVKSKLFMKRRRKSRPRRKRRRGCDG